MGTKPRRRTTLAALALLGAAALLPACGGSFDSDGNTEFQENTGPRGNPAARGFVANFDLSKGLLPSANNLLFSGSADGTLNIPIGATDSAGTQALKGTLNALDGFSTVAPISTTFTAGVSAASLVPGSVRVFEVTLSGIAGAVTGVTRELTFGAEFAPALSSVDPTGQTLAILWLRPLKPRTTYMVALTDSLRSADGRTVLPSDHYLTTKTTPHSLVGTPAAALEPVRQLVQAQEAALARFGVDPAPVVLSWAFTTQSVGNVLAKVRDAAAGVAAVAAPVGTTATLLGAGPGLANVYVGTLTAPYYLDATK
ncbi:MAG: lipase, partial [Deferrisomatales bacterium]